MGEPQAPCRVCQDRRVTPCPAKAIAIHNVCAFCGGRAFHHDMACRACNKDGLASLDSLLADLGGFGI